MDNEMIKCLVREYLSIAYLLYINVISLKQGELEDFRLAETEIFFIKKNGHSQSHIDILELTSKTHGYYFPQFRLL